MFIIFTVILFILCSVYNTFSYVIVASSVNIFYLAFHKIAK